jgi:SAM-dependent methyltransferase
MDSVNDYVKLVEAPWGKLFYELLFAQLNIPQSPVLNILDFGSGLGVTANHYAGWHNITAVEPSQEMIDNSRKKNAYTQILGGIEKTSDFPAGSFDLIFCHNVLEYTEHQEEIVAELLRVLKTGGQLSVVKHNRAGRVFHSAVFENNPQKAASLFDNADGTSNYLGTQHIYSNEDITIWIEKHGGTITNTMGMRAFWALGQDNLVKYDDSWYHAMLELEQRVSTVDCYKEVAFFNHIIAKKD